MAWGAIAAAGINLVGGILANRGRRKEAEKDRNFQERMSSTSYQRGKDDLEAAGMNPALAYRGGASTPGGAMAGVENVTEGAVSSAMQAKRMIADLKAIRAQTKLYDMQTVETRERANVAKTQSFRNIILERNDEVQNKILQLQLPWANASARAIQRFPTAAVLQLLLNSGGSQALGLAGALGGARILSGRRGGR